MELLFLFLLLAALASRCQHPPDTTQRDMRLADEYGIPLKDFLAWQDERSRQHRLNRVGWTICALLLGVIVLVGLFSLAAASG